MWYQNLISIIFILLGAFLIRKVFKYFLKNLRNKKNIDLTLYQTLQEVIKYLIYAIALVVILGILGVNLTTIAVSLGFFSVAIGFGARDTISNFISGIFIFADKNIKVGDIIEISNQKGRIVKIGFRTTTLLTYDKRLIKIPNSVFSANPYVNYTTSGTRMVELNIIIPHKFELEKIIQILEETALTCEDILKDQKPTVIIKELSDMGTKVSLCFWINDPWEIVNSRSNLAKKINKVLPWIKLKKKHIS